MSEALPVTGNANSLLITIGALLMAVGGAFVSLGRRVRGL
jgi:LPXTG-motif cell wall-anchored protein